MRKQSVGLLIILLSPAISLAAGSGDHRLVEAAKKDDTAAVGALLKQGGDIKARQGDGATALHWAAYRDDDVMAALLIAARADVNAANDLGVTPLWVASSTGGTKVMETLLRAGSDPNIAPKTGGTPLMIAARNGNVDGVRLLVAHGADVNASESSHGQNALMWAVAGRKPQTVQALIKAGANLHARTIITRRYVLLCCSRYNGDPGVPVWINYGGFTPLLFAARSGDPESAKDLLDAGANPNDIAADGNSALTLAALSNQGDVAALLIDYGADVNYGASATGVGPGFTALHGAVLRSDVKLAKLLLARGANPDARTTKATPARRGSGDVAFDTDLVGATPFLLATREGDAPLMRLLAASGADVSLGLLDNTTPLMVAARGERGTRSGDTLIVVPGAPKNLDPERHAFTAVKTALELGADVNAANHIGETVVHVAARKRFDTVIQLLAQNGARLDARDARGQTPIAVALTPLPMPKGSVVGNGGIEAFRPRDEGPQTAELLRTLGARE